MRSGVARQGGGEGGPTPEQIQAMRQQRQQNGGRGGGGRSGMGSVWVVQGDGKLNRIAVRILANDLSNTAIEPVRGALKEGDKVVTKLAASQAQQNGTRSLFGSPPGPGPGGGFRPPR